MPLAGTTSSVTTRGFGTAGGFAGGAGLVVTMGYGLGAPAADDLSPGGVFRRADPDRDFRRTDTARVFRRADPDRDFRRRD